MVRLEAITLGCGIPRQNFNATVHSVFPQAANLSYGKASRLLTLVTSECADLPQGIRLDSPLGFIFEGVLHPGMRIVRRNSVLMDETEYFVINLGQAMRWKCRLPKLKLDAFSSQIAAAYNTVWQVLNERRMQTGAELRADELFNSGYTRWGTISKRLSGLIQELVLEVRMLDPRVDSCLWGLIGLGQGLTPSGDDFLVGFLTGLYCTTNNNGERLAYLSKLGKKVVNHSSRTNDISRTYLWYATRGQVSSRLSALVNLIATGENSNRLRIVAEDALKVGHSSGMETVTGLLIGLSTWGIGFTMV